jgi:hypothetical protein
MTTIYQIVDPRNGLVVYVGRSEDFETRKVAHQGWGTNCRVVQMMEMLKRRKLKAIFEVIEEVHSDIGPQIETCWIYQRRKEFDLFNETPPPKYEPKYITHIPRDIMEKQLEQEVKVKIPDHIFHTDKFKAKMSYCTPAEYILRLIEKDMKLQDFHEWLHK